MAEVINSSIQGSINDITNLKFFTAKGYEIPMQKSYVLTWELVPGNFASDYIKSPIYGYFIGDIDFNDPNNLKIKHDKFETQFINQGEIYLRFATQDSLDSNGMPVYSYSHVDDMNLLDASYYYDYLNRVFLDRDNQVKIAINIKNTSYTYNFNVNDIFALNASNNYEDYTTIKTIYTGENVGDNQEFYQMIGISKIDFVINNDIPVIQEVFEDVVPNLGNYFPFVRYAGDFYQDKVSENFIATDTILVLEEIRNENDTYDYTKPFINADSEYSLVFQPSLNSELKLIDKISEQSYNLLYKDEIAFSLANGQEQKMYSDPFSFAIAFQASEEGAYQNLLGIYLRSNEQSLDDQKVFFMGAISVKTEVEGEDERFRTLLTNFGIPDPANYSNIFAEQDYQEEGKDFNIINRKSKELMLTYDQIFSYVGTYKALFRAIKFLGYQDIIFKEWYTINDQNDKLTDIAVQIFDSSTGSFLKQKLADYGVSIEDFNNYNKLNKISMIYHFNERSDEVEKLETYLCQYNSSEGRIDVSSGQPRTIITEVPMTKPIFTYRNEETLAKLFAVKQWLEQHIIGVGAYISDITGEGIYFGWQKTQGYQTQHHLNDFSQSQYYTADVKQVGEFINSSAIVSCTLNELNNAVRFIDYEDTPIDAFTKYEIPVDISTDDGYQLNTSTLIISNSIEAPVLGDEYEFDLIVRPNSGTLYEWTTGDDSSSQILIQDGEIKLLRDNEKESIIDSSCLPIITLENANIHNVYGNWRSNIKWMIRESIDSETGNTQYSLKNYNVYLQNSNQKISNQYIIIEPASEDATIKYSEKNKWDIPMFIIHGYKFSNVDISTYYDYDTSVTAPVLINENDYYNLQDASCDFILEILKGDMLFKSIDGCGCQISFSTDLIKNSSNSTYVNEQLIEPTYTYHSDRMPFVNFDSSMLVSQIECSEELNDINIQLIQNINNEYQNTCNIIQLYLNNNQGIAYNDASTFSSSIGYISDVSAFIDAVINSRRNEILNSSFNEIIKDNYTFNRTIDTSVTRLGNYDVIVRAFDKYNNIFTSKYDNTADVVAAPIPIDTFAYNDYSHNDENFYRFNKHGELKSIDDTSLLLSECDTSIKYPKTYHIYDIDYNTERDYVEFDNISYAIDTPKNNDYVIFDTLNERCINSSLVDGSIRLSMLDENPNKIGLYANVFSGDKKQLSLFAYDSLSKEIFTIAENLQIVESLLINQNNDTNYESDSYIIVNSGDEATNSSINDLLLNCFDNYKVCVLNTTEYKIISESSSTGNIIYNYDNCQSVISINANQVFNNEDVVKIRYCMDVSTSENKIINETAYRIINVNKNVITNSYEYTLNGLPNSILLDSSNVNAYITYVASHPVKYVTNIVDNAYEYNEIIGYENYSIIRDHFNFNQNKLFLDDYIDDTYGIEIDDYNYVNGKKYWFDYRQYIGHAEDMNMYYYHQFPISITQGDEIIFRAHNSNNTFKEGYKKDWKVSVMSIDDIENTSIHINNNNKETLFRSVNDKLSVKPYMLGSHNIQLICTDIYGNRLVNDGEGLLYVKESKTDEYKNYSYI